MQIWSDADVILLHTRLQIWLAKAIIWLQYFQMFPLLFDNPEVSTVTIAMERGLIFTTDCKVLLLCWNLA